MSESIRGHEPVKPNKLRGRAAAAILAIGLLTGAAAAEGVEKLSNGSEYAVNHEISTDSVSEAAELRIANDLASQHHLDVAKDIRAIVGYSDGSMVQIENPIIEKIRTTDDYAEGDVRDFHVAVAERTRGSDAGELSIVTAYAVGERGVTSINYHGTGLHPDGEDSIENINIVPMPIERMPGVSHEGVNNFFTVTPSENDVQHTDLVVAQGTLYINQYAVG